jgi:uncharacterized membrane protein
MDAKLRTLFLSVAIAIVLWVLGGFVINNILGTIFVTFGIALVGCAGGNVMNSPEPDHKPR